MADSRNLNLSAGFWEVLRKCLQKDPGERFQNSRELRYALEHYDEMDIRWRRKQRRRLGGFLLTAGMSLLCLCAALGAGYTEQRLAENTYQAWMERALAGRDRDEKMNAYEKAVSLNPAREEGYLELLDKVFLEAEEDGLASFDKEEDAHLRRLLGQKASDGRTFETHLKKNQAGYDRLAYTLGLAYYYDYEGEGNKSYAAKWLNIAAMSGTLPQVCRERALRLGKIGEYYSRIGQIDRAGDLAVSYGDYWEDLVSLTEGNILELDNAVTALRMYQELASQIHSRTIEFQQAGVTREEMEEQLNGIWRHLKEDFAKDCCGGAGFEKMRADLEKLLREARRQIEAVYKESGGKEIGREE